MSKDPAVLFYTSDFLTGVSLMSDDQVGKYIKLLCIQYQKGGLTKNQIVKFCGGEIDEDIFEKFKLNGDGFYYNERMKAEAERRHSYKESRINNLKGKKGDRHMKAHMDNHMETETETEDINTNGNYLYVGELKIFDVLEFLRANFAIQMENLQMKLKLDIPKYAEEFMADKAQESFEDNKHILNSFKKFCSFRAKDEQPKINNNTGHRNYYDNRYEKTLNMTLTNEYHKHLISLGWTKITAPGGTNWTKPK